MEYASGLVKLKPGSESKLEEWRRVLESRLYEAAVTLRDEDVVIESYFTIDIGGEKHLLWYLRAKSIRRVCEISRQLKHPIDKFHYEVMDAITALAACELRTYTKVAPVFRRRLSISKPKTHLQVRFTRILKRISPA